MMSTKCRHGMTHVSSELAISLRFLQGHKREGVVMYLAFKFRV
jgi:hypothetical protein